MEVRELYETLGVPFEGVLAVLRKEDRIKVYLEQTVGDPSFAALADAMAARDYPAAFRAAHTIKGMGLNLMLNPLTDAAVPLVECLRSGSPDEAEAEALYGRLKKEGDNLAALVGGLS
ncbi:Hpt domain-containing protein [Arabiibacter massiliensis]|uniref:Hpt domain-containing protein n=1 Tax=Arabiibacter massiliensis TaxID=1870985 RepID=UPI000B42514F|nr:Hpt domain-containing protein [Arabiibacter massiliensis]